MDISSSVAAGLLTREAANVSTIWTMLPHSDSPEDFRFTDEPADVTQTKVFVRLMSSAQPLVGMEGDTSIHVLKQ